MPTMKWPSYSKKCPDTTRLRIASKTWNIKPTPEGTCGVQQSLEERLKARIEYLVRIALYNTIDTTLNGIGNTSYHRYSALGHKFTYCIHQSTCKGKAAVLCFVKYKVKYILFHREYRRQQHYSCFPNRLLLYLESLCMRFCYTKYIQLPCSFKL